MSQRIIKGSVVITRGSDDRVRISVRDSEACVEFCEVDLSLGEFALAVTAQAVSGVKVIVRGLDLVGTKHEVKTEFVPHTTQYSCRAGDRKAIAAAAFAPFEVDGWKGRSDDLFNGHRMAEKDGVRGARVTFTRNVPIEVSP